VAEEEYVGIFNPSMWLETHGGSWGFVLFCIFFKFIIIIIIIIIIILTKNQTWIRGM
jgi:uncharacterized membrane protein